MKLLISNLIIIFTLLGSVMILPNAYADDFVVSEECVGGTWKGIITNLEGEIIPNTIVRTIAFFFIIILNYLIKGLKIQANFRPPINQLTSFILRFEFLQYLSPL